MASTMKTAKARAKAKATDKAKNGEIIAPGELTRREWAKRINDQWRGAAAGMLGAIFQIGRDLNAAKLDLGYGQFMLMVKNDLKFSREERSNYRIANMFMRVADDQRLSNVKTLSHLPPYYATLYKITRLEDDVFERLLSDGTIRPAVTYAEINKVLRTEKVKADEQRVLNLVPIVGKFRTLVIDPAWEYDWLSLAGRAKPGYAMQTLEQLFALDLKQWAEPDCELYCWTTNNFSGRAHELVAHWGFQHRTLITWIKPPPFGLGSYFRNSTEHVLYATLGDRTTRPAAASIPTHFEAPRGEHSEKPEKFYEIVRAASYPPYGEGNQRTARPDFQNLFVDASQKEAAE
jgi:N6-adenosine-specific RNA methylase IME4